MNVYAKCICTITFAPNDQYLMQRIKKKKKKKSSCSFGYEVSATSFFSLGIRWLVASPLPHHLIFPQTVYGQPYSQGSVVAIIICSFTKDLSLSRCQATIR